MKAAELSLYPLNEPRYGQILRSIPGISGPGELFVATYIYAYLTTYICIHAWIAISQHSYIKYVNFNSFS